MGDTSDSKPIVVRLFQHNGRRIEALGRECDLERLGGHLPISGDVLDDADFGSTMYHEAPEERQIYKVVTCFMTPEENSREADYCCMILKQITAAEARSAIMPF